MDTILHRRVTVNGISLHVAEKGTGPVVLFLHGFPELWLTWRHQILSLSALGYRAVAPDLRGYADSDAPPEASSYSCHHIVGDLIGLIDELKEEKVYVVGHDWGAWVGWFLCLFRGDRVKAFVALSVPFRPRNPKFRPVQGLKLFFGDDYYMCRFQKPGEIEEEIAEAGTDRVLAKIICSRKPGPPCIPKGTRFGISPDENIELPSWFSEDVLAYYVSKYNQKGFTGALNYYRALDLNWELMAPWDGAKVKVPVKYIVGDLDMVYTTPGAKEYIQNGGFKKDVPFLEEVVVMEGVGHFLNQERPEDINSYIHEFISNH